MAMSKAIDRLKLKVPPGKELPGEFSLITSNRLPLTIAWSSLKSYGLKKSAELELLPFIQLADGSLVAVWYTAAPPAIVFVDAHGESRVSSPKTSPISCVQFQRRRLALQILMRTVLTRAFRDTRQGPHGRVSPPCKRSWMHGSSRTRLWNNPKLARPPKHYANAHTRQ